MLLKAYKTLKGNINSQALETVIKALNTQLIYGKGVQSTPYLIDLVGQKEFLKVQKELISLRLINSKLQHNFALCEINTATLEELGFDVKDYIFQAKVIKYTMNHIQDYTCNSTRYRPNFIKHHNDLFKLDVEMLEKYQEEIYTNTVTKMIKERAKHFKKKNNTKTLEEFYSDLANEYEGVIREVINNYISNPNATYCLNGCNLDYRKRAIAKGLTKVLNPISYKVGRALVKLTDSQARILTPNAVTELNNIYLFIAEEVGNSSIGKTIEWKVKEGKRCYKERIVSNDIHVRIWMERIYTQLDTLNTKGCVKWVVPIEIDFSMSMAVVVGLITGHSDLVSDTNTVYNATETINDPWNIEGVRRKVAKSLTAQFYGSSESLDSLNKDNNVTQKELRTLKRESAKGKFGVLLALGRLLKDGSNIKTEKYTVTFPEESYEVEVKKERVIGAIEKTYFTLLDDGEYAVFTNHVKKYKKDYKQNRLSLFTGLVHHDDSYLLEGSLPNCFALPIHDAVVTSPWGATEARENARVRMIEMYSNRKVRLMSYLKSIGVVDEDNNFTSVIAMQRFKEFKDLIIPYEGNFENDCSGYAMK